jgi:glyoxylase I family protein
MGELSRRLGAAELAAARGSAGFLQDGPAVAGSAEVQLAFRVPPPEVEECHKELLAKGVEILSPAARHRGLAASSAVLSRPEGNIVEIYAEL